MSVVEGIDFAHHWRIIQKLRVIRVLMACRKIAVKLEFTAVGDYQ